MSKYLCLCGMDFKKKKEADSHIEKFNKDSESWRHQVFKKYFRARVFDIFFKLPLKQIIRLIGVLLIYTVIMRHWEIKLTFNEAILIGLGMGFII